VKHETKRTLLNLIFYNVVMFCIAMIMQIGQLLAFVLQFLVGIQQFSKVAVATA